MKAGDLRHRIRIDQLANVLDSSGLPVQNSESGEITQEWTPVATVWAQIAALSSREKLFAEQTKSEVTTRIVLRYRADVDARMRLVYVVNGADSTIYNIVGIIPDPDSWLEWMTIEVKAGLNDG